MATIKKRENGKFISYEVRVRKKGHPTQTKTFRNRQDAEKWGRMIEAEMDRGVFVSRAEAESTTLKEALERYEKEVTPTKKGAAREKYTLRRWFNHELASRFLAAIRAKDIAAFRDKRRSDSAAENTIRIEIALLSHVFETARREWGMESLANPCRLIKLPANSSRRDRRLNSGEEARLIAQLEKSRNSYAAPIVRFAIETAMRQGEMLALDWADVDFKNRVAHLSDTKNGDPRDVPLSPAAVALLHTLPRPIEGGRVFRISRDGLSKTFILACQRAEINDLRFHDLRHEATSRLFESGKFDMMEVAAVTGHKTLQMLKRYTHLRAEDLARKFE